VSRHAHAPNDKHLSNNSIHDKEVHMHRSTHLPTPEQIELARWTASLGAVTAEALAHRRAVSVASARARLVAAQRAGLLSRKCPLAGRPSLFSTTRAGLRVCGARGMRTCDVKEGTANHLIECAAVAAALERCYPDHRVGGERELRRDEQENDRLLASTQLGWAQAPDKGRHRPDLVLWPSATGELPVAVEVELTIKAHKRLVEICRAWARSRTVAGVLYFAPSDVERALLRAIEEAHASERIIVLPLDSLPGTGDHNA
jgi:hypothetical protein